MLSLINDGELAGRALEIACEVQHPIHDCFYLAEAENRGDTLVTADKRFLHKVADSANSALVRGRSTL